MVFDLSIFRLTYKRVAGEARLLAGAFIGSLITATVVAGGPVYLRTLERAGVEDTIDGIGEYYTNLQVSSSWVPLEADAAAEASEAVRAAEAEHLPGAVLEYSDLIRTRRAFWGREGEPMRRDNLASRAMFQSFTSIEDHIVYLLGEHPTGQVRIESDGVVVLEASIISDRAAHHDIRVGDILETVPEIRGIGLVKVHITGIFAVVDPREEFWLGLVSPTLSPAPIVEGRELPIVLVTQPSAMLGPIADANAGLPATYTWFMFVDRDHFKSLPLSESLSRIRAFEDRVDLDVIRSDVLTSLEPRLRVLETRMLFARIPMLLLAALALASIAYYLFMVAGIISRRRASETSMMRSRGISIMQIARTYVVESIFIAGIPALTGPLLAIGLVSLLGLLPFYATVTESALLPVEITWTSWLWSFIAGVSILVILLIPAIMTARRGVIDQHQSEARPDRAPLFQRYYLDVIFLGIGGLIWWELSSRGSIVASNRTGEVSTDVTLLFSPAVFLMVVALLFLRAFPLIAHVVASLGSRLAAADVSLGLWRLRRSPYWYAWPVLLLVLVTGLGVVSGTLASTLARSTEEQILYSSGADFRFSPRESVTNEHVTAANQVDGVIKATPAFRSSGRYGTTALGLSFDFLAVDSVDFAQTAWFREDFSDTPFSTLTSQIAVDVKPEPIFIPPNTVKLGAWSKTEPRVENHFLWLVVRDSRDRTRTITLGQIEGDWRIQTADLSSNLSDPAEIVSVQTFMQAGPDGSIPTTFYIDDIYAENAAGERTVLIDFDESGQWVGMPTSNGLDVTFDIGDEPPGLIVNDDSDIGASVAKVSLDRGNDQGVRGIYRTATGKPLPVVASEVFMASTNTGLGSQFIVQISGGFVPAEIVDVVRYFPTLDPRRSPFLVANINSTLDFLELRGLTSHRANQLFVRIEDDMHDEVLAGMRNVLGFTSVTDRAGLLADSTVDPLVVAGWRGMSIVSIVMAGIAAAFGYFTYLAAHAYRTRRDSAFLQSMGMPAMAFGRLMLVEHAIVAALGMGIGIASGLYVSRLAVSSLTFTESGGELLPPFIMQTNWVPTLVLAAVVAISTAISIFNIVRRYRDMPLHELTRGAS